MAHVRAACLPLLMTAIVIWLQGHVSALLKVGPWRHGYKCSGAVSSLLQTCMQERHENTVMLQ